MSRIVRIFQLALGTLTIVPVGRIRGDVSEADVAASRLAYPLVGLLLGGCLALMSLSLWRAGVRGDVAAWGLVATLAILTGGLHWDGLADTFDGLFLGGGPERRLDVMRDPHIGSHGVLAIVLVALGKVVALQGMTGNRRAWAVLTAVAVGRCLILLSAGMSRYARAEGTGRMVIAAARINDVALALVLAALLGALCGARGVLAALVAMGIVAGLTGLASRRLGGITGDILGATVELGELAFLLALG